MGVDAALRKLLRVTRHDIVQSVVQLRREQGPTIRSVFRWNWRFRCPGTLLLNAIAKQFGLAVDVYDDESSAVNDSLVRSDMPLTNLLKTRKLKTSNQTNDNNTTNTTTADNNASTDNPMDTANDLKSNGVVDSKEEEETNDNLNGLKRN